jgi:methyl-accepting chemotaxis protein
MMSRVEEVGVESYSDMASSANLMMSTMKTMSDDITSNDKYIKDIFSGDGFRGPLADYLGDLFGELNTGTINNVSNLSKNAESLNQITQSYQDADKKSSDGIGGVM